MRFRSVVLGVASFAFAAGAATVERIVVRQQWPWREVVDIDFVLSGVTAKTEIDCAVYRGDVRLELPLTAFSGDVCSLTKDGVYRIRFDPSLLPDRPAGGKEELRFALAPVETSAESAYGEVFYKIVDLVDYSVTDVTRGDLVSGMYGSVETDYGKIGEGYTTTLKDVLIWTGVTNNPAYKTTKLVLRRIPAGTFNYPKSMIWGGAAQTCEITNDFYIGVFEMTQGQYKKVKPLQGSYSNSNYCNPAFVGDENPLNRCSQNILFGVTDSKSVHSARPANANGFLKPLNDLIGGGRYLTLPTQAQWLYACRAGSNGYYYDGLGGGAPADVWSDPRFDVLGRYAGNGGVVSNGDGSLTTNGVVAVGSYRPNAFGLYDMLGNVVEMLFDSSYKTTLPAKTGNLPDTSSNWHVVQGSGWSQNAAAWQFAETAHSFHTTVTPSRGNETYGFRLVMWIDEAEASQPSGDE